MAWMPILFTEETGPKWIPCSERLPETTGDVLVTVHWNDFDHEVRIDNCDYEVPPIRYFDTALKRSWGCGNEKVVAWMPLPEPAKLGGD